LLSFTNDGTKDLSVSGQFKIAAAGGLGALASIDVTTAAGATTALGSIESMVQTSIDAAAEFGSSQKRIEIQADFVGKLSDALKSGIGTLVDADMEETSARLQALQVQQQLATQSLSIANQQPQNILALFR
jgi:flagellin